MYNQLFSPLKLGSLEVVNRIGIPPMCQWQAHGGRVQPYHLRHYGNLAACGAGLVIVEATAVDPEGCISPHDLGLWSDEQITDFKNLFTHMKLANPTIKVGVQINHAGRKSSPKPDGTNSKLGRGVLAPSALGIPDYPVPMELTVDEILLLIQAFAAAARRAKEAGADTIQIHSAHGYLIHQFLSPLSNQRTDNYGGSLENRMRFGLEIVKAIIAEVGADYPLGIRVSATDWLDNAWDLEQTIIYLTQAQQLGVKWVDVSTGGLIATKIPVRPAYQISYAQQVKQQTSLPVYGVGLITEAFQAESLLALNAVDGVSIGRAVLNDPNWGWHAAKKLNAGIDIPDYIR